MQANLAASPVVQAVEAKRAADAARANLALEDVAKEGKGVVDLQTAQARSERAHPGLERFMRNDRDAEANQNLAMKEGDQWSFMPWPFRSDRYSKAKEIADKRRRDASAFFMANNGLVAKEDYESPDAFLARGDAERAKLEAQGKALGVPFGSGISAIEALLERIAQNTAGAAPAPLQEAQ